MVTKQPFMRLRRLLILSIAALSSCTSPRYRSEDAALLSNTEEKDRSSEEHQGADGLQNSPTDAFFPIDSSVDESLHDGTVKPNSNDSSVDSAATSGFSDARTEPIPARDSSTGETGSVPPQNSSTDKADGSNPIDITPEAPEWARDLIGRYAMRVDSFRKDVDFFLVQQTEILLSDFSWDGERVMLSLQVCSWTANWNLMGVGQTIRIVHPHSIPKIDREVYFNEENWQTLPKPFNIGFQKEPLVPCTPGEDVLAHSSQEWIPDGMCTCYDNESIPVSPNDCRVDDIDSDGNPGISLESTGTVNNQIYYAWVRAFHYVNGTIVPDGRHTADESLDSEKEAVLSCLDNSPMNCVPTEATGCRPRVNSVQFVPLPSTTSTGNDWTCVDVNDDVETLLPAPPSLADVSIEDC